MPVDPQPDVTIGSYSMTPVSDNTRVRTNHSTFSPYNLPNVMANKLVLCDAYWTAPSDGDQVKKGDIWGHVTYIDGIMRIGWMAHIHKGELICDNFKEVGEPDPTPEESPFVSGVLTRADGTTKKFTIIEKV